MVNSVKKKGHSFLNLFSILLFLEGTREEEGQNREICVCTGDNANTNHFFFLKSVTIYEGGRKVYVT